MRQPVNTVPAIDVSASQGVLDWPKVAAAGVEVAFVEVFVGNDGAAPDAAAQIAGARAVGIRAIPYCFAYALPADGIHAGRDPVAQVAMWLAQVAKLGVDPSEPMVVDAEFPSDVAFAKWKTNASMVRAWFVAALAEVERRTGVTPWIYGSRGYFEAIETETEPELARYPLWLAEWGVNEATVPGPWTSWTAWQYSSQGNVQGIADEVDLSWVLLPPSAISTIPEGLAPPSDPA